MPVNRAHLAELLTETATGSWRELSAAEQARLIAERLENPPAPAPPDDPDDSDAWLEFEHAQDITYSRAMLAQTLGEAQEFCRNAAHWLRQLTDGPAWDCEFEGSTGETVAAFIADADRALRAAAAIVTVTVRT